MSTTLTKEDVADAVVVTQAEQAAEPKKKREARTYVVLREVVNVGQSPSNPTSKVWEFLRNVTADSPGKAVEEAASVLLAVSEDQTLNVTLVAVLASRFKPVPVSIEVKTQLKFG
jgi:hypothetical protein